MTTESQPPPWLTITLVVLYYILYPVFLLFKAVWYILLLLSTPIIYIGRVFLAVSLIPWRIFTRFETLWYFIASAILLGVLFGLILHFTMRAFVLILRLDREPPPPELKAPSGHDAVSYRKAREAKKRKQLEEQQTLATQARLMASQPLLQEAVREARKMPLSVTPVSPISPGNSGPSRPGLLQQTILEHSDEDDDSSVF